MTLTEEFCFAWRDRVPLDDLLFRLVAETDSRASGCWRVEAGFLNLVGFGWAADMPDEVSQGFQNATRHVSLEESGLGIVKAAVSKRPAIGRRDAQVTGLGGSASWIVKFRANTSLAVPIHSMQKNCVVGVLAISTAAFVEEGDSLWRKLIHLSFELGRTGE